ncbi:DUF2809 domain-containing protein [Jiulongibacter sediminis]|jgi:hypothetical protein|uniref:DUF2809 domain-containing protein n=1 Tax=Jiulongibacter sediminis TaxID=1605367 RepID=UPI0026F2DE6F|nr:DUF2809 domain-containing protein [Jiulongibacter sediminis]
MMLKFQRNYALMALFILCLELCIALFFNDRFIRPFVGDVVATAGVYCLLRIFDVSKTKSLIAALLISFVIELLQYIHFLEWAGLYDIRWLRIVLGSSFSVADLWAYAIGGLLAVSLDVSSGIRADGESDPIKRVWSDPDAILLIFAGCSAEFALSKHVDWLFFTGKIPNQPIDRMVSTLSYAQKLLFTDPETRKIHLQQLVEIHAGVGQKRGFQIPNEAFMDVLNMLIFQTIEAYETCFAKLSQIEKEEIFLEFRSIGEGMQIQNLPNTWEECQQWRAIAMQANYSFSHESNKLFDAYKRNLGSFTFGALKFVYKAFLPQKLLNKTLWRTQIFNKSLFEILFWFRRNLIMRSFLFRFLPESLHKLKLIFEAQKHPQIAVIKQN